MRILYVVNPTAGGGRAAKVWSNLCDSHPELLPQFRQTTAPGDAETWARTAAEEGYDAIVAVGGDGTLHEVVNGSVQAGADLVVGHIPCGTGNDFARSFGLPRRPDAAWRNCIAGRTVLIDLGKINERVFINVAGFGFDAAVAAEVSSRAPHAKSRGTIPYLAAVFKLLRTYRPRPLTVEWDGASMRLPIFFGAVGNGSTYGGGMKICPRAQCDDGHLDVCLAGDFTRPEALLNLIRVFWGGHIRHHKCTYRPARELFITGDPTVLVHADGQMVGHLPIRISILPAALRFLHPAGA